MAVEEISDRETVCRLVDDRMQPQPSDLILELFFPFEKNNPESLVWTRYAPIPDGVHDAGRSWQAGVRTRRPGIEMRYLGFMSANVGVLRSAKTKAGHGFQIVHEPTPADYHAEISIVSADPGTKIPSPQKVEARLLLREKFSSPMPI
jgi:hypothetical protein